MTYIGVRDSVHVFRACIFSNLCKHSMKMTFFIIEMYVLQESLTCPPKFVPTDLILFRRPERDLDFLSISINVRRFINVRTLVLMYEH